MVDTIFKKDAMKKSISFEVDYYKRYKELAFQLQNVYLGLHGILFLSFCPAHTHTQTANFIFQISKVKVYMALCNICGSPSS